MGRGRFELPTSRLRGGDSPVELATRESEQRWWAAQESNPDPPIMSRPLWPSKLSARCGAASRSCTGGLSVTKGSLCCLSYRSTIGADSGSSTRLVWLGTRCLSARPCPHDSGRECRNRTGPAGRMRPGCVPAPSRKMVARAGIEPAHADL